MLNDQNTSSAGVPIVPQNTGEWNQWMFPSFRQSLLGGKSLNRFSSFVTSGAEEWVLNGKVADTTSTVSTHEKLSSIASQDDDEEDIDLQKAPRLQETDRHFIDSGHAWKSKVPLFKVLVHSPSKRTSILSGAYTIYNVTSMFEAPCDSESESEHVLSEPPLPRSPTRITVQRRFSQFVILHTALTRRLPGISLPPLPEKQYSGRFSDDFVEARRGDLERYIRKVVRHPVARYAEVVTWFLSCESDSVRVLCLFVMLNSFFVGMETSRAISYLQNTRWTVVLRPSLSSRIQLRPRGCRGGRRAFCHTHPRCWKGCPGFEEYLRACERS